MAGSLSCGTASIRQREEWQGLSCVVPALASQPSQLILLLTASH